MSLNKEDRLWITQLIPLAIAAMAGFYKFVLRLFGKSDQPKNKP
jgi:hypothetical protein